MDARDRNIQSPAYQCVGRSLPLKYQIRLQENRKKHDRERTTTQEKWRVTLDKAESDTTGNYWLQENEGPIEIFKRFNWQNALKKYLQSSSSNRIEDDDFRRTFCATVAGLGGIKTDFFLRPSKMLEKKVFEIINNNQCDIENQINKKSQRFDAGKEHFAIMPGDGYAYTIAPHGIGNFRSRKAIEEQYIQEKAPAKVLYQDSNITIIRTPEYDTQVTPDDIAKFRAKPNVAVFNAQGVPGWLIYNHLKNEYYIVDDIKFGKNSGKNWEEQIWCFDCIYRKVSKADFAEDPRLNDARLEIGRKMAKATGFSKKC